MKSRILLVALLATTFVLFNLRPQKLGGTPCILASPSIGILTSTPAVQQTAKSELESFCKATLRDHELPSQSIELEWTQTGKLQDMGVKFNERTSSDAVQTFQGDSRVSTNPSDQFPFLVEVQGLRPYDLEADSYSIYAFQVAGSVDVVSDELISKKQWEQIDVFNIVLELEKFAQELDLPRSEVYFIDIGANLGTFSLGVAAAGFKVIAIEAMSVNQFALSMSLCANKGMSESVTLLRVALGKEAAQCTVFSAKHNVLDGTIRCGESGEAELLQQG
jgi:hypothetical protein